MCLFFIAAKICMLQEQKIQNFAKATAMGHEKSPAAQWIRGPYPNYALLQS
jgi:hypothetical protein